MTQSGVTPRLLNVEQYKRRIDPNQPIANIYRNAIDLNRFSNGVARQIVRDYNSIILSAVDDLRGDARKTFCGVVTKINPYQRPKR